MVLESDACLYRRMRGIIDTSGGLYIDAKTLEAAGFTAGQSIRIHVRDGQILLARQVEQPVVMVE